MAFTLNRRLAQLVDSNGQLNTGKIPNDYITSDHVADNTITSAMLHTSFTVSTSNLTAIDTDDVSEGSTNLYYTNARVDARLLGNSITSNHSIIADNDGNKVELTTDGSIEITRTTGSPFIDFKDSTSEDYDQRIQTDSGNFNFTADGLSISGSEFIDSSRNIDIGSGTISSGAITSTGEVEATALDINGNGDISGNLTLGGYLAGPATFTIDPAAVGDNTGTVVIAGNLQVDGTTTTINSTTMTVDDLNLTLASGAANSAAANGAGIIIEGPTGNATLTWDSTNDYWLFNKSVYSVGSFTAESNLQVKDVDGYGSIELGGGSGAFIDMKTPFSDDFDARIIYEGSNLQILTNSDQPILLRHNSTTVLETSSSGIDITGNTIVSGDITTQSGGLTVGVSDTTAGVITVHGGATGTTEGGEIRLQTSADYDGTYDFYRVDVNQDDFRIGRAGTTDFYIFQNGLVKAENNFEAGGRIITSDGIADTGQAGSATIFNESGSTADFRIESDAKTHMFFLDGGLNRIGINTASPTHTLHILNEVSSDTIDETNGLVKMQSSGGNGMIFGTIASSPFTSYIQSAYVADTSIAQYNLALNPIGGNVGIGTTSPSADLHISKTSGAAVLKVDTTAAADAGIQIKGYDAYVALGDATNGLQWYLWNDGPSSSSTLKFGSQALSASDWYADASQAMVITSSGNVGIADTSPSFKLDVNNTSSRVRFKASSGDSTLEMSAIAGRDYAIQSLSDGRFRIYDEDDSKTRLITNTSGLVEIGSDSIQGSVKTHGVIVTDMEVNGLLSTTLDDTQRVFGIHSKTQNQDFLTFRTRRITSGQTGWNHAAWEITRDIDNTSKLYNYLYLGIGDVVINQDGANIDFRVESDTNQHMLFVDGGSNRVGIGTASPAAMFDVNGVINIKGNAVIDSDGTSHYLKVNSGGAMYFFHGSTNLMYYSSSQLLPGADNARDLGSTSLRWRNIYTTDLHLSNEGKPEGNQVDGTTGNWTIQEGEEHLYIINNKNGKKYKFALEEIE